MSDAESKPRRAVRIMIQVVTIDEFDTLAGPFESAFDGDRDATAVEKAQKFLSELPASLTKAAK